MLRPHQDQQAHRPERSVPRTEARHRRRGPGAECKGPDPTLPTGCPVRHTARPGGQRGTRTRSSKWGRAQRAPGCLRPRPADQPGSAQPCPHHESGCASGLPPLQLRGVPGSCPGQRAERATAARPGTHRARRVSGAGSWLVADRRLNGTPVHTRTPGPARARWGGRPLHLSAWTQPCGAGGGAQAACTDASGGGSAVPRGSQAQQARAQG